MSEVSAPCAGRVLGMAQVPDDVFAAELVGAGVAIDPDREAMTVVAPVAGRVVKMHPHAFVLLRSDGAGVLVHLGIDTVRLAGEGFEVLVSEGATVEAGQDMVRWDPASVEKGGRSPIVPVCVMDTPKGSLSSALVGHRVAAGDVLFTWPG